MFLWFAGGKTAAYLTIPIYFLSEFVTRSRNTIAIWAAVLVPLALANFVTIGSVSSDTAKYFASKIVGDASFTGRTEIWQVLLFYTSLKPITGAGFQSFWQLNTDSPALRYGGTWLNTAFYGHQGYLDLAAAIGIPGIILALGFVIWRPLRDICAYRGDRSNPIFAVYVTMWLMPLYLAITESNLFDKSDPSWVMMLIGIACLRRMIVEQERTSGWASVQPIEWQLSNRYSDGAVTPQIRAHRVRALEDRSQDFR
jgi:O-antigen ligase